jgi:hypothetical protein
VSSGWPPAQASGQAFEVVAERVRRVEFGDALDEGVAFDLDPARGADGRLVGTGEQDAGVIDVVGPRTDRAEIRENGPDFLGASRDGAAAVRVGHVPKLRESGRPHRLLPKA